MFSVTIKTNRGEQTLHYSEKVLLSEALQQAGIRQNKPCGGKGICGKCKVLANGKTVLSCTAYVDQDTYVDYTTEEADIQGLTEGTGIAFPKDPLVKQGYGMAIDIGTTTIAAYLYEFPACVCVETAGVPNRQTEFGADVISRIEYANNGGLAALQKSVLEQIQTLTGERKIETYVITGNTTMLHLFAGLDPRGIAVAPFTPKSLFGTWQQNVYLPRCISSYVGADITTAILASGMTNDRTAFLVDIGTNGEMALWHQGRLVCCSTAAGPAFEGGGISCGMLAVSGAICKVFVQDGTICYETIDKKAPVGICGTGLIDAVAALRAQGLIDETGYMEEDYTFAGSDVTITVGDIRQMQLAKSAIRSGIDTLLHTCGITCEQIERFYIAGGFGSFINKESAAAIGLIPHEVLDKVAVVGNGAGTGAAMILQSRACLAQSEQIAAMAETVELSGSPYFMERYVDNMMFL